jgi:transposase
LFSDLIQEDLARKMMRGMARKYRKFSPEFKDEAVKLVVECSRPIAQVARELGINEGTLGNWVNQYRRNHVGDDPPLDVSERARLREAERELRELRMENEFRKKVIMPADAGTRTGMRIGGVVRSDVGAAWCREPVKSVTRGA